MASRRRAKSSRKRQAREPPPARYGAHLRFQYVETSALLAALLEHDPAAQAALRRPAHRVTSALTFAEAARAFVRTRHAGRLTDEQHASLMSWLQQFRAVCDVMDITETVLARAARAFPQEPVRTLDAIHLASAELVFTASASALLLTRDARIIANARALGYTLE